MAAKKQQRSRKKNGRMPARRRAGGGGSMALDARVADHVRMVMDPCNAVLAPNAYRGKDGFITRVNTYKTVQQASTDTCAVVAYWPRFNRTFIYSAPTSVTAFSIDFWNATYGGEGPGGPFFGTNAAEVRPVAACITCTYTGSELNRQGQILSAVVPYKSITGSVSCDRLAQLAAAVQRVPDSPVEVKWIPSPENENYSSIPTTNVEIDGDDNILFHVYRGFAANTLIANARFVGIFEWQPFYNLGIQTPSPNTPDAVGGLEKVRTILASQGNWWTRVEAGVRTVDNAIYGAARVARAVASTRIFAGAARAVPLLMA
nr:MAG: hypothetical protein [Crogonang virus 99]